ncbi:hypothetical protein MHL40_08475 [Pseudomonas luteola]|uniref:hypothetical protein n=1 Tax=Pseudomonas luteola TaxID=47886 RepID=UPI001EF6AE8E|nr:hypothetical protein [Pseudomonas luteola]MCG7372707.1 hypothetical protein [Pseudomonas luteola]
MNVYVVKNSLVVKYLDSRTRLLIGVFIASLLLSCIAVAYNPIIGRDASMYMDVAGASLVESLPSLLGRFDWPWFSILLGKLYYLTGLPLESLAHIICELLTACACVLLVDLITRERPDARLLMALLVLALPSFNDYRGDILRENGFWFFSILALWLLSSFKGIIGLFSSCLALAFACFFRLEAIYLIIVPPIVWMIGRQVSVRQKWLWLVIVLSVIVLVIVALVAALHAGLLPQGRVTNYVMRLDVSMLLSNFNHFSLQVAQAMPQAYARDDASLIVLFGLFGYLLYKTASALGFFVVPLLVHRSTANKDQSYSLAIFNVAALGYAFILMVFLVSNLFMSQRYVAFLTMLLLPQISVGLYKLLQRWPYLKTILIVLLILMALANVVSLSAPKTQIRDAGQWIGTHIPKQARVYMEDSRISYYAGWGFSPKVFQRDEAIVKQGSDSFEYFALDLKRSPEEQIQQVTAQGLTLLATFKNDKGETYGVFQRKSSQ